MLSKLWQLNYIAESHKWQMFRYLESACPATHCNLTQQLSLAKIRKASCCCFYLLPSPPHHLDMETHPLPQDAALFLETGIVTSSILSPLNRQLPGSCPVHAILHLPTEPYPFRLSHTCMHTHIRLKIKLGRNLIRLRLYQLYQCPVAGFFTS